MKLRLNTLIIAIILIWPSAATAYPLLQHSVIVTDHGVPSPRGLVSADFDGDGNSELVLATSAETPLLLAFEQRNGAWEIAQFEVLAADYGSTQLSVYDQAESPLLLSVTTSDDGPFAQSTARLFQGWPPAKVSQFDFTGQVHNAVIADSDGDGQPEVLISGRGELVARRLDGSMIWSMPASGPGLAVANLDTDPAAEIVIGSYPGGVYDGATRELEWSYVEGFGKVLATGRVGTNGSMGFVSAGNLGTFRVFQSSPWSPLWGFSRFDIDDIEIADLDGDGDQEIIQGDGQWGSLNIIDTSLRQIVSSFENPGHGFAGIATVKQGAAVSLDLAFAPRSPATGKTILSVLQPATGLTTYQFETEQGEIGAVGIGDVDADGRTEVVSASSGTLNGRVRVSDFETGQQKWISPPAENREDPYYISGRHILLTQLDADPASEMVIAGSSGSDGRILVVDGSTKALQLQIGLWAGFHPLDSRRITGVQLIDYDMDGIDDLAVSTEAATTGVSGVKLFVFSLLDGSMLWESISMGSGFALSKGLYIQPGISQQYLVAVLPTGLRAYGGTSQLLEWTYEGSIESAVYFPHAQGGPEVMLEGPAGSLTYFDPESWAVLRTHSLPGASTAIATVPDQQRIIVRTEEQIAVMDTGGTLLQSVPLPGVRFAPASIALNHTAGAIQFVAGAPFGFVTYKYDDDGLFRSDFERVQSVGAGD